MTPIRGQIAYKMITQSDDASATALYGVAGGDSLIPWIETHYGIDDVGSRPTTRPASSTTIVTPWRSCSRVRRGSTTPVVRRC